MDKDFQFLQELVDILSGLPVHLVPSDRSGVAALTGTVFRQMLPTEQSEPALQRILQALSGNCIYELSSPMDLHFAVFPCEKARQLLVLGPCRQSEQSREQLMLRLQPLHLPREKLSSLVDFCVQQPIVPYGTLHRLAVLFAQRMLQSTAPVPFQALEFQWDADMRQLLENTHFQELEQIRTIEGRYEASAALTEAVKQGNLSLAYRFIDKMGTIPEDLTRNPNPLRNAQNLCIILNTQLRHALEEVGVPPYPLDQLSGSIARQIEKFTHTEEAHGYFTEILRKYCELAQEKEQANLSPFARLAVTYIQSHLSDNLTVKDAAKALLVNPDYLSAQFHKEVGISFIAYVNRERTRQAAALLQRTDLQIQQIASVVGYNNTSYFAKQFLKYQGCTPRAYRKIH